MNHYFVILSLLILIFTPAFGALSDRTGLKNEYIVDAGGYSFTVETVANYDENDFDFDKDSKKISLQLDSGIEENLGEMIIPLDLLSGNFTFHLDGQPFSPKIQLSKQVAFVTFQFNGTGKHSIDVFGTDYLRIGEKPIEGNQTSTDVDSEKKGGGCLIATATYGSELAPQVQQLRELRDNQLLQTTSGSAFMSGFNQFYYSFSPTVADWERENPAFKELVKITLTPMLSSLSLLNNADMDSDSSVLAYGLSLILLNVGMYFVAPAIIIHKARKLVN